jgi:putative ABC transport system ATP-binding protein
VDNNLEIMPGEIVIMTGPSGSGKTTLLTLIGALRTVQEGRLEVLGRDLGALGPQELVEVRRGIGFIFQAHNLFESLTAYQNVRLAQQLHRTDPKAAHERAVAVLTDLGLKERIYYKPDSLSGGQRQRVAIGRALVNKPKLILADEPTAALDEKSGRSVVTLLQDLAREQGTTSLIVTHDNRILDVADRIVSLVDGQIKSNVLAKESVAVCLFLSRCAAFAGLTPDTLAKVAEKMTKERHPAGAVVFRQGEEGDKFYLIRRGEVDVVVDEGLPTKKVLATMKEGDFFGEMALLTGEPRRASIVARDSLETFALGKADFQTAIQTSASFKEQLYKAYFQRQ